MLLVVGADNALGPSGRVTQGYTTRDLEFCLGEDHHKIQKWIASGWLRDGFQGTGRHDSNGRAIHGFRDKVVLDFIRRHPNDISLGKVDQTWFLDLALLQGHGTSTVVS